MAKNTEPNNIRMLALDVYPDVQDKADRLRLKQSIRNSIKLYRHVARQIMGVCFAAQSAGADLELKKGDLRIKPNHKRARAILAEVFAKDGKAPLYQCRDWVLDHLAPSWLSFVWDSVRNDVWTLWNATDPALGAGRGYLALQGVRRLARMNGIGIGMLRVAARAFDKRALTLKWDHELGPVRLRIGRVPDASRYCIWNAIVEGRCKHGTIRLSERRRQGRSELVLYIPYELEMKPRPLNPGRVAELNFLDSGDLRVSMREGHRPARGVPVDDLRCDLLKTAGAIAAVDQKKRQDEAFLAKRRSCGSRRDCLRGEGIPAAARTYDARRKRLSQRRQRLVQDWNHCWSKRIVARCVRWDCARLKVFDLPSDLRGRPWQWHHFRQCLAYKACEAGLALEFVASPNAKELVS